MENTISIWFDSDNSWEEYTKEEFEECFNFVTKPIFQFIDKIFVHDMQNTWIEINFKNGKGKIYNNVFGTYVSQ